MLGLPTLNGCLVWRVNGHLRYRGLNSFIQSINACVFDESNDE